jgi:O-antigen/teichoic acid export membrane protein
MRIGSFVKNVSLLTIANLVTAFLSLVQGIFVARWLGPDLFGLATLVMAFPNLIYTFFHARTADGTVKFLSEFHARDERLRALAICRLGYLVDICAGILAFLAILILAGWASRRVVHNPETAWLIVLLGISLMPRSLVSSSKAVLVTLKKFNRVAAMTVFEALFRLVLVIGLILYGWKVEGVVWGYGAAFAVTGIIYLAVACPVIRKNWGSLLTGGTWGALKGYRRKFFRFIIYTDLNALLGIIPKQLDVILLGYFHQPVAVGYYKLAKNLANFLGLLVNPLQSVIYPDLSKLWGLRERAAFREKVKRLAVRAGVPLFLAALAGIALLPILLPLIYGREFLPAVSAAQLLMLGSAVWLGLFWLRPVYLAQGNVKPWFIITTVVVVLTLAAYPIVIPGWGYPGLAVLLLSMQVLSHSLGLAWLRGSERRAWKEIESERM